MNAVADLVVNTVDAGDVRVDVVTDWAAFQSMRREWDALVAAASVHHPFLHHDWLCAWWRAFGTGKALHIVTVREHGRLIAAAPLMLTEQRLVGLRARTLESLANDHTPRFEFMVADGYASLAYPAIWQQLTEGQVRWDVLQLRQLPTASPTLPRLVAAATHFAMPVGRWPADRSPYVLFDGTWDEYFAGLGHNHRRNIGKGERRLERIGTVALEVVSSTEGLEEALADGMRIEALAWKAHAGTAMVSDESVQGFYQAFARRAAEEGTLRLLFLVVGGKRIAFSYGLLFDRTIFVLKGGYDPEYSKYSPYNVLYSLVFRAGFADRLRGYEFLGADEPFKLKWTELVHPHCWLYVFSRSPRGRLLHYLKFIALPELRSWRPYEVLRRWLLR